VLVTFGHRARKFKYTAGFISSKTTKNVIDSLKIIEITGYESQVFK